MAQIMGKSMRFVISVPIATGREIVRMSKDVGMAEYAFTSASLIIGARSLSKSKQLMAQLTQAQAMRLAEIAVSQADIKPGRAGRKPGPARKVKQK
jgi:hypothetical protein